MTARAGRHSRLASALESVANVAIGHGVALGSQLVIFPLFGIHRRPGTPRRQGYSSLTKDARNRAKHGLPMSWPR